MEKINSFKETILNPDKIVNYAKEKGKVWKQVVLLLIDGCLLGYNFFNSNLMVPLSPFTIVLTSLMLILGIFLLSIFVFSYLLLTWLVMWIYLTVRKGNARETNPTTTETPKTPVQFTKKDLKGIIKLCSYCFLIPFLIFHLILFGLNNLLISINYIYVVVYINAYGKYLLYAWIFALTLYSDQNIDKTLKYKFNAIIFCSFLVAYAFESWLNFSGVMVIVGLFL